MSEHSDLQPPTDARDPPAADGLLPLVYDELRKLAAVHLANEQPGQTLQPTALVHEAYLRLLGGANPEQWSSRVGCMKCTTPHNRRCRGAFHAPYPPAQNH